MIRALSWNLFHGRDLPPDPALITVRSRLLRIKERNATHRQVNRDLLAEFCGVIAGAEWDVALLQECPPRWAEPLARACRAGAHRSLTSRNSLAGLRTLAARLNPDLIASNEGGSNLTLVRGEITERRELELCPPGRPERRTMAFTGARLAGGGTLRVANLHASAGARLRARAETEVVRGAAAAVSWSGGDPLVFGGDLNLRPHETDVYDRLASRFGLAAPTAPGSLDHLLARGLEIAEPAAAWAPERREVIEGGLAIRLSDHAPVAAAWR